MTSTRVRVLGMLALGAGLAAAVRYVRRGHQLVQRPPSDSPAVFLRAVRDPATQTLVVCAGDSITHGRVSANYVRLLRKRLGSHGYQFVNAGINGNLAYNLLQRLDDVIACRPDVVTVQIGSNDVLATQGGLWRGMYLRQRLPQRASLEWYQHNLERILDRLQRELDAQVLLLSMPMLGEELGAPLNQLVVRYNQVVKQLAEARGVTYLPLYETLAAELERAQPVGGRPFRGQIMPMYRAIWQRFARRATWDEVAAGSGLLLLTDYVHLSERAATIMADLIAGALEQLNRRVDDV